MNRKKNILFIDDKPVLGGGQVVMRRYLQWCSGYKRVVIRDLKSEEPNNYFPCEQVHRISFPRYPTKMRSLLSQLRVLPQTIMTAIHLYKICLKEQPTLLIINSLYGLIPLYLIRRFLDVPIVLIIHNSDIPLNNYSKKLLSMADAILCVSKYITNRLSNSGIANCQYVANPIPDPYNQALPVDLREKYFSGCSDVLIYLGRLAKEKNLHALIRGVATYNDTHPDTPFHLLLAGAGPEEYELQQLIENESQQEYIKMSGYVQKGESYLRSFDAVCLVSLTEGMPLAILEAFIRKIPVIGTNVNGITGLLENGKRGVEVRGSSAKDIAEALTHFRSASETVISDMVEQAYSYVRSNMDMQKQKEKFLTILDNVQGPGSLTR